MFAVVSKILGPCRFELECDNGVVTGYLPRNGKKGALKMLKNIMAKKPRQGFGVEIEYAPTRMGLYKIVQVYGPELNSSSKFIVLSSEFVSSHLFR
mgnify:CR=1 FL=1